MITNIRPRVLNKEASPSVIKNTEMLDAVNIVADGLESSEQNTIKKIPGTIEIYFNDDSGSILQQHLGSNSNKTHVVVGHCVDKDRDRVFYFCVERDPSDGANPSGFSPGKIYMIEQFSPDEVSMVLLASYDPGSDHNFVASNIIRVPVSEEDYGVDQDFSGVQQDNEPIFEFDDSVDIGDIQGELVIVSEPFFSTITVNPTQDPPVTTGFLEIQNVGGAIAYNTYIEVGEGSSPQDPVDQARISISTGQDFISEIAPQQTVQIPVTISTEGGIESGVYDFYIVVTGFNGSQQIPIQFNVNVNVLNVVNPRARVSVQGPGQTGLVLGERPQIYLGPIQENSGSQQIATVSVLLLENEPNSVYPPLTINTSVGQNQQYVDLSVGSGDTVGSEISLGAIEGTMSDVNDIFQFQISLKDDNGPFEETFELPISFSTDVDVASVSIPGAETELYSNLDCDVFASVTEEEVVVPADLFVYSYADDILNLPPNITTFYDSEGDFNGTSVQPINGGIVNTGDVEGYYWLNLRPVGGISESLLALIRSGLSYSVGGGTPKQIYSMDIIQSNIVNDGYDLGFDISSVMETIDGGGSGAFKFFISNDDDSCQAGLIQNVGDTFEGNVLINENSAIGYPSQTSFIVEVHRSDSPDINYVDLPPGYNDSTNPNIIASAEITVNVAFPSSLIQEGGLDFRVKSTTAYIGQFSGMGQGVTKYYTQDYCDIMLIPQQELYDNLVDSSVAAYSGNTDSLGLVFAAVNPSIASSTNPGGVDMSVTISTTENWPAIFGPFNGSGQDWHNPNPFNSGPFDTGSLGNVILWTEPQPIGESFDPDASLFVNTSYQIPFANNSSDHEYYGGFRNAVIQVPSQSVTYVMIKPIYSNAVLLLQEDAQYSDLFGDGNYDEFGLLCQANIQLNGGISNAGQSTNEYFVFPFNTNQYEWIESQVSQGPSGAPAPKSIPLPVEDNSSSLQVTATQSNTDNSEVGSLTVQPTTKKIVKKSSSLNRTKIKKSNYGK